MDRPLPAFSLRAAAVAAMRANGFESEFPPEVAREVAQLDDPTDDGLPPGVHDLRALHWSSIDNRESRDLDQVEVAEALPDGGIRVRIGIADVFELVQVGSPSDRHAATNTTSVYTGVVVFPMLPERLSTDLTSLNEGEDRFALVIQFDVAGDGSLGEPEVFRALLRNHAKLTYESVGAWLDGDGPEPDAIAARPALGEQLRLQDEAARRMRSARVLAGALAFESVEARPVVSGGRIVDLEVPSRNRARDLIEDFMIAANRSVAVFLMDRGSPSLRRVVREPRRWDRIVALAAEVGESLPDKPDNVALGAFLLRRREADPEHFPDLSLAVVKLLGPGVYVLERRLGDRRNTGHFGLGVADYVHSTAPNRRFADLVTQRMLGALIDGRTSPYSDLELEDIAARCTERSDAARKVERTMRKIAGAAMVAERVGDDFTAVVTASSRKGIYARVLRPPVEGRIVRGGERLDVGDTVRLTLVGVDVAQGYIDFAREAVDTRRKLERSRRKKANADRMRTRVGEHFDAEVTGVSAGGTWVRTLDGAAEGRVVRGYKGLTPGTRIRVRLVATDSVHGFIDFERDEGIEPAKLGRVARKQAAARALRSRIGDHSAATVTGVTRKATWIRTDGDGIEGRLVRGFHGLAVGQAVGVVLLAVDARRGFIDFAREDALPA